MTSSPSHELAVMRAWLEQAGRDPRATDQAELLAGGVSGASTYLLHEVGEPCVFKLTLAEGSDYVRERSAREVAFYRELAPSVPVATPRVLATGADSDGNIALLLAAYQPSTAAPRWSAEQFVEVAGQLAQLHATFWDATELLSAYPWLRTPNDIPRVEDADAWEAWRPILNAVVALGSHSRDDVRTMVARGVARINRLREDSTAFSMTLCHGDCHVDNLLRDAQGGLVWTDWQEVGIGRGPDDLSFLIQRAMTDGAHVPEDAMVQRYCDELAAGIGVPIASSAVQQVMDLCDLYTRLLIWPPYLVGSAPERLAAHVGRIVQLLDRT